MKPSCSRAMALLVVVGIIQMEVLVTGYSQKPLPKLPLVSSRQRLARPSIVAWAQPSRSNTVARSATSAASEATDAAKNDKWKNRFLQWSTIASLLCIVDCTVLPLITILVPLLGIVSSTSPMLTWLHAMSHPIALYFVVPMGSLATSINVWSHKNGTLAAMGYVGVLLVLLANMGSGGCTAAVDVHHIHAATSTWWSQAWHAMHHGVVHRVVNLSGCALMISSNLWSRQLHQHGATCTNPQHKH